MSDRKLTKDVLENVPFIDLNHKSHFTLLAGIGSVKDHIKKVKELGHKGISLTETSNMYGALELYNVAKDEGTPFVIGTEIFTCSNFSTKELRSLNLYAKNEQGWKNLCYLSSTSSLIDHREKESKIWRTSLDEVKNNAEGLLCSVGSQQSIFAERCHDFKEFGEYKDYFKSREEEFTKYLKDLKDLFKEDLYVEIHPHNLSIFWDKEKKCHDALEYNPQSIINKFLIKACDELKIKKIITAYPHMTDKTDHKVQMIMLQNDRKNKDGEFFGQPYFLKSVEEIYKAIQKRASYISDDDFLEMCKNTVDVMNKCSDLELDFEPKMPDIDYHDAPVNSEKDLSDKLEKELNDYEIKFLKEDPDFCKIIKLSKEDSSLRTALKIVLNNKKINIEQKEHRERLTFELNTIQRNGVIKLVDYFLLLEDVSNYLVKKGNLKGFGRGSGCGSIFAFSTDITDCEPLEYELLFERFLTQDRIGTIIYDEDELDFKKFKLKFKNTPTSKYIKETTDHPYVAEIKKIIGNKKEKGLQKELFFLECNEVHAAYLLELRKQLSGNKIENKNNSVVTFLLGITDNKPTKNVNSTPTTLPDIDYDSDSRDVIKKYLVRKYGFDRVTLLGTFGTLKTKGAIKDVMRQLRPSISFADVNDLTKRLDNLEKGEIQFKGSKFFEYALEESDALRGWFNKNKDVKEAVFKALGNVKNTGIHAGGIVVTSEDVVRTIPMQYIEKEDMWATQGEMTFVEAAGLIKFDFLGLSTLEDLNRCMKLINEKEGGNLTLNDIPLDIKEVFKNFYLGKTESVFQFKTFLATNFLIQIEWEKVKNPSVVDLAIITSIARPGPLNMGMDKEYIGRVNGDREITYMHPSLEPILKSTLGICVFQEQVMSIVKEVGGLSGPDSVVVLKAMGKKQLDKLTKFKAQFIKNSIKKYPEMADKVKYENPVTGQEFNVSLSETIWMYLEAFAEYGFNKSHAIAYACTSYYCMYFKENYPTEWKSAVLTRSDKEDFKELYKSWKDDVKKPDINESRDTFIINKDGLVVMPFSSINGVGNAAVENILESQSYESFEDFFEKVDKRKVSKTAFSNLIFSGCFDSLMPSKHYSEVKWRKELYIKYFKLKFKEKKPAQKTLKDAEKELAIVSKYTRGQILMKQIETLNFTSFDYYDEYFDKMTTGAKKLFGSVAIRPEEIKDLPNNAEVVIGGAIESTRITQTKSGKNKGKDMMFISLVNDGESASITIFPNDLDKDAQAGNIMRDIKEFTPIIIRGTVNHWNNRVSIIYRDSWILV